MGIHGKSGPSRSDFPFLRSIAKGCSYSVPFVVRGGEKIWDFLGRRSGRLLALHLADHAAVISNCCQVKADAPTKPCFWAPCSTRCAHPDPKISIASHAIPCHPLCIGRRDGQTNAGAATDPEQGEKRQAHTGNRLRLTTQRSGARASRHLPQVASAAGRPAMGQTADRVVAATRSAFSISGA